MNRGDDGGEPEVKLFVQEASEGAVEFHGQGGLFMVVGLRMGLTTLKELEARDWFDISCRVEVTWLPDS